MTDAMRKKIEDYHKEEIADRDKYKALAEELRREGYDHCAGVMCDMAHEEETHAHMLSHILNW